MPNQKTQEMQYGLPQTFAGETGGWTMNNRATTFARDGVTKPYCSKMKFMIRHHDVYDILSVLFKESRRVVACMAEVVQYFSNWDEWKQKTQRTPWIYKPLHQIEADLRAYSTRILRYAISRLEDIGIIERRHNPENCLDRVYQYRIHLDKLKLPTSVRDKSNSTTKSPDQRGKRRSGSVSPCLLADDSSLKESPSDTLLPEEPVIQDLPWNKLSGDTVQDKSSFASLAGILVVDDFTPLANSFDPRKYAFASGVQINHKNQSLSNRSISLSQHESESGVSFSYQVIAENSSFGAVPIDFYLKPPQVVAQEDLAQALGKNKVKKERSPQERIKPREDKSSAAATVTFVEKPHQLKSPQPDYYLRGFNSQLEKDSFYQALLELGKQKAQVRSPVRWANNIIKDINAGGLCEYLNEYRRGEPLGMCEKQEWEIAPGQVYPRFLRFLNCRLKTNQMSGEQSIAAAHKALRDKGEAMELWESFKRTVVNFAAQWERDKTLGVSGAYVPPELLADADVTIEEAAVAMQLLQSNSVQSHQSPELVQEAPPDVIESASASMLEALASNERQENLVLKAQIERMREFLKSDNSVKVRIARKWVESNLDVVEPIKVNGVIVDVSTVEPNPVNAHIKVGDVCYYGGQDYSWEQLCKRYPLTVLSISDEMATVSAPRWYVTQEITLADLRLIE